MKKIYTILFAFFLYFSSPVSAQVNYGSCQTLQAGQSPCFFAFFDVNICEVSIGTLNYTGGTCNDAGYLDLYSTFSGTVATGNSYTFRVKKGCGPGLTNPITGFAVWVDWNNDGDFSDTDEQVVPSTNVPGGQNVFTYTVTVPANAVIGDHRMRVRSDRDNAATSPCTNTNFSDAKDFKLIVEGGTVPCDISLSTSTVNPTCGNANGSIDLTVSGGTSPFTYLWSNSEITEDLSNLLPNKYLVDVTDANGCSASTEANITDVSGGCVVPSEISAGNISASSTEITWASQHCAYRFQIRYRATGAGSWTSSNVGIGANTKKIGGLSAGTEYEVQVRANCNSTSPDFTAWSASGNFTTDFPCVPPANVTASNFRKTRTTLSWDAVPAAYSYEIRYKKTGTTAWSRRTVLAPIVAKVLTGLTAASEYEYQVRTICDVSGKPASAWSDVQTFNTHLRMEEVTSSIGNGLMIYPNPSNGSFTVKMQSPSSGNGTIQVQNMLGQLVYSKEVGVTEGENTFTISFNNVAGLYNLVIKTPEVNLIRKISVDK